MFRKGRDGDNPGLNKGGRWRIARPWCREALVHESTVFINFMHWLGLEAIFLPSLG
jgi:hypothetical protein